MNKKLVRLFVTLFMFVGTAVPAAQAAGLTGSQIQAILSLLSSFGADNATIANVNTALGGAPSTDGMQVWCHTFNIDLKIGDGYGATTAPNNQSAYQREIYYLQTALQKEGFTIAANETTGNSFRDSTASAVTGFQEKYASSVLNPVGLSHGTGYVGASTRAKLNALYGCSSQSAKPSITVLSPNGGEQWQIGKTYDIKWSGLGVPTVDIILSRSDLAYGETYIAKGINVPNGVYSWMVPTSVTPGSTYEIRIEGGTFNEGKGARQYDDSSNAPFTIYQ